MISSTTFTHNVRGVLCALAVAALLTAGVITRAQHQGQNMRDMPGMNMSQPKAKPKAKRKAKAKAKVATRRKKRARPTPKKHDMGGMNMNGMTHGSQPQGVSPNSGGADMPGMGSMNMGPLLVMSESDMAIRVGSSQNNLMSMGAMGSGTSWQPASGPRAAPPRRPTLTRPEPAPSSSADSARPRRSASARSPALACAATSVLLRELPLSYNQPLTFI